MRQNFKTAHRILIFFLLAICSTVGLTQDTNSGSKDKVTQPNKSWQGLLEDKSILTRERLDELLAAHVEWLNMLSSIIDKELNENNLILKRIQKHNFLSVYSALQNSTIHYIPQTGAVTIKYPNLGRGRLTLTGADLTGIELANANLQGALLSGTNLRLANLRGATLESADLGASNLGSANIEGANLNNASLEEAYLSIYEEFLIGAFNVNGAQLKKTTLSNSNLRKADLSYANLEKAELLGTNLEDAKLSFTNLKEAIYEVKPDNLPNLISLRNAKNLETMRFKNSPHALENLKQAFKKIGYRQQEREITYALKRSEFESVWRKPGFRPGERLEAAFNWFFFDFTVRYSLEPFRALKILAGLIFIFTLPYAYALFISEKKEGIWKVWPHDRLRKEEIGSDTPELITLKNWRVLTYAFYFSLLSAFNIGWRELNVGNWITRLQTRPYILQPSHWVRMVSGLQSLISVYLLAICVLSYFGRPFE